MPFAYFSCTALINKKRKGTKLKNLILLLNAFLLSLTLIVYSQENDDNLIQIALLLDTK